MTHLPKTNTNIDARYMPVDHAEKEEGKFVFNSLTNLYQPRDQYTNPLYQIATGKENMLDEHIHRLARMIEARGEYAILVKRKIDGEFCECYDSITQTLRRKRCYNCYGTRIRGGYDLFWNDAREDGKIIIAAPFADQSIKMEDYGLDVEEKNTHWTLPYVPLDTNGSNTFSYDFIVRFNHDGTEMSRSYVTSVKPSRSVDNRITYQTFQSRVADPPRNELPYGGITGPLDTSINKQGDIIYAIDLTKLNKIHAKVDIHFDEDMEGENNG